MKGKIFNAQEVQAILNGSKVMFREVIKHKDSSNERCPYQVGETVFVKEKFLKSIFGKPIYFDEDFRWFQGKEKAVKFKSPVHMKQEHSRLTLLIKSIGVERLQDISEEDAIKEGISKLYSEEQFKQVLEDHPNSTNPWKNYLWYGLIGREITRKQADSWENQYSSAETAKDSFASLWNATHKKPEEKFEASPWVFVYTMEVVK